MFVIKKFGKLTREEQIQILEGFMDKNEEIFLPYTVPGIEGFSRIQIESFVKEDMEYISEGYFEGTMYLYDEVRLAIDKKIEKIVYNYLENNQGIKVDSVKSLLNSIKDGKLEKVDRKAAYDIRYS